MPVYVKRLSSLHNEGPTIEVILFPPAVVINDMTTKGLPFPQRQILT